MNHSIYTADKATHLKVVVSVLLASIVIMATTLTARMSHSEVSLQATATRTAHTPSQSHALTEMARTEKQPI